MSFTKGMKTITAAALSAAMLFAAAACGTSDGSDSAEGSGDAATITSYDVSGVKKDAAIAALLPESVTKDGKLTIGTNPSYAPAEFLDADGKTQIGYDMDLARALGNIFGLKTEIVSSNFDTIIPSIGSKYDLGIAAFTITPERMKSVDFVSYFTAGMGYAVKKGNPEKIDPNDLCGLKVAVETGTVEEEAIAKTAKQCKADGKKDITVQSSKQQTDATTAVVTGKADVFFADSPVVGYAIAQTGGELEQLGEDFDSVPNAVAIKKGETGTAEAVQKAMQKLMDDGTYGKILKHWGVESGALDKAEINPDVEG
ncbi:ABC transporter substrate-binding protein [Bifidobacterium sp. CP2]|uniref:ABC transporter substrate-binding protein n=1 Tax=Bifidobacterium TaxID=1678 RepID=UPI001BDC6B56|nr:MULTISPECIES: ABC transporter substrate-binding protein [Bifidobacterium]MBT1182240.1 ABC transporter substrate-binding protein [Bifidobacterium sp. CP2]MBW3080681.1 ABC transporter substrate-binding protein [Bifidobacterium saguinibicoloris]